MRRGDLPQELREKTAQIVGPYSEVVVLTREQKQHYLAKIATGAAMHAAAREIGVPYLAIGRMIATDEQFANDLDIAKDMLRPMALEEIAIEQATVGVDEVLTHQGRISYEYVGEYMLGEDGKWVPLDETSERRPVTVKKIVTSNPLLVALLKANNREKFTERTDINVRDNTSAPDKITSEGDRAKLIALLAKRARARKQEDDNDGSDLI